MPKEIYLVKVGMSMTEGVVDEWYIPDGGSVAVGELIYRLETEKVNLDVDAEASGIVKHLVAEGVTKEPGDVVGYIFAEGEAIPDNLGSLGGDGAAVLAAVGDVAAAPSAATTPTPVTARSATADGGRIKSSPAARRLAVERGVDVAQLNGSGPGGRIVEADVAHAADNAPKASPSSPIARKLARELSIDLANVKGTGPGGRITKEDVEAAASSSSAPVAAGASVTADARADQTVPMRAMRRTIANRMYDSLQSMAQLTMDMDVAMDETIKLRGQLIEEWAAEGVKPTYTDLVIKAVAKALVAHPQMNAMFGDSEITLKGAVNVGVAVALDEGLIVPVVRNADLLSVKDLAKESARLAVAAREGSLGPDDLADGTFTVSALGMFGVDAFTPIINAPQAGILGVNRIRDDTAWDGNTPVKVQVMRLSLTWDHRVLDGAPAAQFLGGVRDLLEKPFRLLV